MTYNIKCLACHKEIQLDKERTVRLCDSCLLSTRNCLSCEYVYYLNESISRYICRRNAPVISSENQHMHIFPTVRSDDWCGEFERKKR